LRFYLNGVLDGEFKSNKDKLYKPLEDLICIGHAMKGEPNSGYYEGFMSQLSIWDKALTAEQVVFAKDHNLLLYNDAAFTLKSKGVNQEMRTLLKNHLVVYLPHLELLGTSSKKRDLRLRNFGTDQTVTLRIDNQKSICHTHAPCFKKDIIVNTSSRSTRIDSVLCLYVTIVN